MSKPKYIIDIDEEGGLKVEGCGFKGNGCELPAELLKAMGQVTSSTKKPEYYAAQLNAEKVTVGR